MAASEIAISFLEGDEHIYIDGSRSPSIIGDATETYFNGSWYFLSKAFSCPFHGAPTFNIRGQGAGQKVQVTMYRFHLTDLIPFRSQARFSIQHGGFNEVQGRYRSLVFYYGADEPVLFPTDDLKISDPQSRSAHNFSGGSELSLQDRDGFFEGENNGQDLGYKKRPEWIGPRAWMVILTITGILHEPPKNSPDRVKFTVARQQEPCEFTVKVDPQADAIMLRRVLDQSVFDQRARIEVNGKLAGIWLNTGNNKWKIWAEDDLILDPALTRGKGELKIKVAPESRFFSAAEYKVFSIRLPD